jgi:hypothetical protein
MKPLLISLFPIILLPAFWSCTNSNQSSGTIAIDSTVNAGDTTGKLNVLAIDLHEFDSDAFYKKNEYLNEDHISPSDSTLDYSRYRYYKKEEFGLPYNLDEKTPAYYFPGYHYYKEEEIEDFDINKSAGETVGLSHTRQFEPIAYCKDILFDFVSMVKDDKGALSAIVFSTVRSTDSLDFDNKMASLEAKLGAPYHKLRISNGYANVIKSNTWLIDNKFYQFYEQDEMGQYRIKLLVIAPENLTKLDSEDQTRFPIMHTNEKMLKERYTY